MNGQVTYFELPSTDIESTQRFWGTLFGWTFVEGNFPGYSMIHGSEPMGGSPHDDSARHPRVFFAVDDIAAAVARVRELGGKAADPVTIPSGSYAHCTDNQGVEFSLSQKADRDRNRTASDKLGGTMDEIRDTAEDVDSINRLTSSREGRSAEIPDSHSDLLDTLSFAHLSSLGPKGEPQSHPVWFDSAGGQLLISTGTDRQKYRNIQRDPRVSVSILDPDNPYRYLEVRGRVVKIEPDPEKVFLDRLAHKYLNQDTYPYEERRSADRVILHIQPDHVVAG